MSDFKTKVIHPSTARTATGQTDAFRAPAGNAVFAVHVSDAQGTTPTLDLEIQYSVDHVTWFSATTAQTFTQMTTTGWQDKTVTMAGPHFRLLYTIGGGSPSFTFAVEALFYN